MSLSFSETPVWMACGGDPLLALITRPVTAAHIGVVIVVGGPQYRAGSHRQFTLLARSLAASGVAVLRFDYRGMGDSDGPPRDFLSVEDDIALGITTLVEQVPAVQKVVLWGLCDAASAVLIYADGRRDPRVAGLCLVNPWVRSTVTQARAQLKHYYLARIRSPEFWKKLLSGRVAAGALREVAGRLATVLAPRAAATAHDTRSFQDRMATAWPLFSGRLLLLLSEHDLVAKEFIDFTARDPHWQRMLGDASSEQHTLLGADHTCSSAAARREVEVLTARFVSRLMQP